MTKVLKQIEYGHHAISIEDWSDPKGVNHCTIIRLCSGHEVVIFPLEDFKKMIQLPDLAEWLGS